MNVDEVQDNIFEYVAQEFPNLEIEDLHEITEVVGLGWDWKEENLPYMKKYIDNKISVEDRKKIINVNIELYRKCNEDNPMDYESSIQQYIEYLNDIYEAVIWRTHCGDDEVFVWCD